MTYVATRILFTVHAYAYMTTCAMIMFRYYVQHQISSVLCILGSAPITNGTATVTINGLECGVTYIIVAGGVLNNGSFVGPRTFVRTVNATNINDTCEVVDEEEQG